VYLALSPFSVTLHKRNNNNDDNKAYGPLSPFNVFTAVG
jgi:hypothetical protein